MAIAQPNRSNKSVRRRIRGVNEFGVDAIEHQLRPPEHLEVSVLCDISPGEIEKSFTPFAMDGWTAKVDVSVSIDDHRDIEFPTRRRGVT